MTDVECPPQGQELCDWVATKIMGWKKEKGEFGLVLWSDSGLMAEEGWNSCEFPEFRPDKNLNHTDLMECRLKEMGLHKEWGNALWEIIVPKETADILEVWWLVAHASAYDRVRAAWAVMKSRRKEATTK